MKGALNYHKFYAWFSQDIIYHFIYFLPAPFSTFGKNLVSLQEFLDLIPLPNKIFERMFFVK